MLHTYVEGQSRVVDGKLELLLKDGTWYPMQSKLDEMNLNYSGVKWSAFNCPRKDDPRFSGLTFSGLSMKKGKKRASAADM